MIKTELIKCTYNYILLLNLQLKHYYENIQQRSFDSCQMFSLFLSALPDMSCFLVALPPDVCLVK